MALKPDDLCLSADETVEANRLEEKIDQYLKEIYVEGRTTYQVAVGKITGRIRNEIVRRYKAAGWKEIYAMGEQLQFWSK